MVESTGAADKVKVGAEYVRFFQSLGIDDEQKAVFLARLLQEFFMVAAKLDNHLSPTGATLHVAVSRMCEADNPTDAPQHRWIRVIDRLGFFGDEDDHASRVVNIGLSYAYRHKELNAVSEGNALRLQELRLSAVTDPVGNAASRSQVAISSGGVVVAQRHGAAKASRGPATGGEAPSSGKGQGGDCVGGVGRAADGTCDGTPAGQSLDVPAGGVVIRGPPAGGVPPTTGDPPHASGAAPLSSEDAALLRDGGVVVATRAPHGGPTSRAAGIPAANDGATSVVGGCHWGTGNVAAVMDVAAPDVTKIVSAVQPVITPNDAAVQCVTQVLEGLSGREDLRHVLQQLVNDSLLCLARLLGGASAGYSAGVLPADLELSWPGVRRFTSKWWPVWEVSTDEPATLPPDGTLAHKVHTTRPALSSRWMIDVNMTSINPVLLRATVMCRRYNKKDMLDLVRVMRVGPGVKYPINVALAVMLLFGTQEEHYCTVLAELASAGRPIVPAVVPILSAACHAFESSGLGAAEDASSPDDSHPSAAADASSGAVEVGGAAEPSGTGRSSLRAATPTVDVNSIGPGAMTMDERYAEMERLLEEEKTTTAGVSRARRVAARRNARAPPSMAAAMQLPARDSSVASLATECTAPEQDEDAPLAKRRRVAQAPPNGAGTAERRLAKQRGTASLALISLCPPRRPTCPPGAVADPKRAQAFRLVGSTVGARQRRPDSRSEEVAGVTNGPRDCVIGKSHANTGARHAACDEGDNRQAAPPRRYRVALSAELMVTGLHHIRGDGVGQPTHGFGRGSKGATGKQTPTSNRQQPLRNSDGIRRPQQQRRLGGDHRQKGMLGGGQRHGRERTSLVTMHVLRQEGRPKGETANNEDSSGCPRHAPPHSRNPLSSAPLDARSVAIEVSTLVLAQPHEKQRRGRRLAK